MVVGSLKTCTSPAAAGGDPAPLRRSACTEVGAGPLPAALGVMLRRKRNGGMLGVGLPAVGASCRAEAPPPLVEVRGCLDMALDCTVVSLGSLITRSSLYPLPPLLTECHKGLPLGSQDLSPREQQ